MRVLLGGALALLLLLFSISVPPASAAGTQCADAGRFSENASIRADGSARAGDFIKPEAAQRSLAERSEEQPQSDSGHGTADRHAPVRISPAPSIHNEPAPPSASIRRAHLLVYRL